MKKLAGLLLVLIAILVAYWLYLGCKAPIPNESNDTEMRILTYSRP